MITATQPITHTFDYPRFSEYAGEAATQEISPVGIVATRRALKAARDKTGVVRHIRLTANSGSGHGGLDVTGPADGTPLLITVASGMFPLRVLSGNVFICALSSWGNAAEAFGTSRVTVLVGHDRKQSTTAHDASAVTVIGHEGARGLQIIRGDEAALAIEGEHHRLQLAGTDRPF